MSSDEVVYMPLYFKCAGIIQTGMGCILCWLALIQSDVNLINFFFTVRKNSVVLCLHFAFSLPIPIRHN